MRSLSEFRDRNPRLAGLKFCLLSALVVPLAPALSWELGRGATYDVYEVAKEGACQSGYKKPPEFTLRYVLKNGVLFEFGEAISDGRKWENMREVPGCSIMDESNWTCRAQVYPNNKWSDSYTMIEGRLSIEYGNSHPVPRRCPYLIKKR